MLLHRLNLSGEKIQSLEAQKYRNLLVALLKRSFHDLDSPFPLIQRDAINWFENKGVFREAVFSCPRVCDFLGLDYYQILSISRNKERIRKIKNSQIPPVPRHTKEERCCPPFISA